MKKVITKDCDGKNIYIGDWVMYKFEDCEEIHFDIVEWDSEKCGYNPFIKAYTDYDDIYFVDKKSVKLIGKDCQETLDIIQKMEDDFTDADDVSYYTERVNRYKSRLSKLTKSTEDIELQHQNENIQSMDGTSSESSDYDFDEIREALIETGKDLFKRGLIKESELIND